MESVIISGESKKDIQILVHIAEKMGLDVKLFHADVFEEFGIAKAMNEGKADLLVDTL